MPGPAIHLLVVAELAGRLQAAEPALAGALSAYPEYANLGAIGPDFYYLSGPPALARADRVVRLLDETARPFHWLRRVEALLIGRSSLWRSLRVLGGLLRTRLELALAGNLEQRVLGEGQDIYGRLRPALQLGDAEPHWSWGDILHYRRTGRFAAAQLARARASGRPELLAYAAGYASHLATDSVGHPYVNTIVGGPYRLHYVRHHLVEMHMDAWAWLWRYGQDLGGAGLHRRIDVGAKLPPPLQRLMQGSLSEIFADMPHPPPPDLADAYDLFRRMLAALTGGDWQAVAVRDDRLVGALQRQRERLRLGLVSLALAYPTPAELNPALFAVPAGPPDRSYPRATVHLPGKPNLAPPQIYPPTPPDGLQRILARDGATWATPPWLASHFAASLPAAIIEPAVRRTVEYLRSGEIPDDNLDGDPVEGTPCWRALDDLGGAYRLQLL